MTSRPRVSLQARLLAAFALLVVVTAAGVAGGLYVQARDVILQQVQDSTVTTMTERLTGAPAPTLPPTRTDLVGLVDRLTDRGSGVTATYGDLWAGTGVPPSPELRAQVADGYVAWQRMDGGDVTYLVVGTQLQVELASGARVPSGIEVYVTRPLREEAASIDQLANRAWLIGGGAMLLALVLATVAAQGVLRPVRELRRAAHRLGEGELTTRLEVRGTDELAGVASTFNDTAARLEHQVGELRRMEADARRFVADVSHELRTPLAAMVAVTDILDEEATQLPGDAGEAARLVSQETRHLTRLVNDLIEISRFDSGAAALAVEDVDLAGAVRGTLRARGWTEQVTTDLPAGVVVPADRRRLDVIVANLVGNALRHGAPPVSVAVRVEPDAVLVEVADHGPGLPADTLPHVFDRFYKADTARGRSEGSGLGLAIAWENARLHGGSLVAAGGPDGGAVFTLRLPAGGDR